MNGAKARWGWLATAAGLGLILWGVLHFTSATVGGPVREFKDRRSYNQVKLAAHRALPATLLLGFAGGSLLVLGAKLRVAARRSDPPRP